MMEMDSSLGNAVFSNSLIISTIFPYLSVRDQIEFAKLNKTVQNDFPFLFRSQDICRFECYNDIKTYVNLVNNPGCHTKFIFDSKINLAAGLKIQPTEPEYGSQPVIPANTIEEGNIVEQFLDKFALQARILKGYIDWREETEITELLKRFPNVYDLDLHIDQGPNTQIPDRVPEGNTFLNIKRLELSFKFDERSVDVDLIAYHSYAEFFADFIVGTFPNVEHLHLRPWKEGYIEQIQAFSVRKVLEKLDNFRNVKRISCVAPESGFWYSLKSPAALERLEIIDSVFWNVDGNKLLTMLLEHHASSLKHVKFPVNLVKFRNLERDERSNFIVPLSFPRLANLEELHLEFRIMKNISESAVFQLVFPQTEINYSVMFPKLETLKIDVKSSHQSSGSWVEAINNVFVPANSTNGVCVSIRRVELVQHFAPGESKKHKEFMERIKTAFPNVMHPIVKERDVERNVSGIFRYLGWTDPMAELI